jgi:hypothetical protein
MANTRRARACTIVSTPQNDRASVRVLGPISDTLGLLAWERSFGSRVFDLPAAEVVTAAAATVTGRPLVLSPLLSSALSAANIDIAMDVQRESFRRWRVVNALRGAQEVRRRRPDGVRV